MSSVHLSVEIAAPRSLVWRILTAKELWYRWNTFLFDCDPNLPFAPDREVLLGLRRLPDEDPTIFRSRVTGFSPETYLRWQSQIPGLCSETRFELQDLGPDRTQYVYSSRGKGWLARLLLPLLRRDDRQGSQRMAWELKDYAEQVFRDRP
ncbi:MAG: SRPBCC domain-containing protein [Cyanobacteria bacterium J06641_5]